MHSILIKVKIIASLVIRYTVQKKTGIKIVLVANLWHALMNFKSAED